MLSAATVRLPFLALCLALLPACGAGDPALQGQGGEEQALDAEYEPGDVEAPAWLNPLSARVRETAATMPGKLGVYVRRLGADAGSLDLGDGRAWHLSTTEVVPVAIAVLEQVDAGTLALDDPVHAEGGAAATGTGNPGASSADPSVASLLRQALRDGDRDAADRLIRLVGEVDLNRRIRDWLGRGFGQLTTHQQALYDLYGSVHPDVRKLSADDLAALERAGGGEVRLDALAALLKMDRAALEGGSAEEVLGLVSRPVVVTLSR